MRARTEAEIKAYADGYNACYKQFCECLKENIPKWKVVKKMGLFVTAVTSCVEVADTPQTERKSCTLELFDDDGNYIEPQTDCGWK